MPILGECFDYGMERERGEANEYKPPVPSYLSVQEIGGSDGARTRDLCRDRTMKNGNSLILKRTDGSESAQKHAK